MKHIQSREEFILNEQLFGSGNSELLSLLGIGIDDENKDTKDIFLEDATEFDEIVGKVIDSLEGGYYHPDMLKDGRVKDSRYGASGETMMGIDRKTGGTINTSTEGKQFWSIIDGKNARTKWKWGYKGGDQEETLKRLVAKMIKPLYDLYCEKYLSEESKKLIDKDPKLMFNFIYAVWNGPGWFQKFAKELNGEVKKGTKGTALAKFAVGLRSKDSNSLIAQGGKKIEKILKIV